MKEILKRVYLILICGLLSVGLGGCIIGDAIKYVGDFFGDPDGRRVDPNVLAIYFDGPKVRSGVALDITVTAIGAGSSTRKQYFVDADGFISIELLGQVKCDGLTLVGLQKKLEAAFRKYYLKPSVTVQFVPGQGVSPYGTVTVLGEVGRPGPVDMPPTMDLRLTKALMVAGGANAIADKRHVQVTRCDKDGKQTKTIVDLVEIGEDGRPDKDMVLKPGDVVWVPVSIW